MGGGTPGLQDLLRLLTSFLASFYSLRCPQQESALWIFFPLMTLEHSGIWPLIHRNPEKKEGQSPHKLFSGAWTWLASSLTIPLGVEALT